MRVCRQLQLWYNGLDFISIYMQHILTFINNMRYFNQFGDRLLLFCL